MASYAKGDCVSILCYYLSRIRNLTANGSRSILMPLLDQPFGWSWLLVIGWTGTGVLEQSDVVTGPWSPAPNQNNPLTVTPTGGARFFRLKK